MLLYGIGGGFLGGVALMLAIEWWHDSRKPRTDILGKKRLKYERATVKKIRIRQEDQATK